MIPWGCGMGSSSKAPAQDSSRAFDQLRLCKTMCTNSEGEVRETERGEDRREGKRERGERREERERLRVCVWMDNEGVLKTLVGADLFPYWLHWWR